MERREGRRSATGKTGNHTSESSRLSTIHTGGKFQPVLTRLEWCRASTAVCLAVALVAVAIPVHLPPHRPVGVPRAFLGGELGDCALVAVLGQGANVARLQRCHLVSLCRRLAPFMAKYASMFRA